MSQIRNAINPFRLVLIITLINCFCLTGFSQEKEQYSRAKIILDRKQHTMMNLSKLGVAVDHGDYRKGKYFISDFSATEIKTIKKAGFKVQILIKDVIKYYQEQNSKPKPGQKLSSVTCDTIGMEQINVPTHFHLGNYGGHFSYNQMLTILDSMQLLYPNLISPKQQIGSFLTIEGRPIYWLRISNNPTVSQPTKPQILYTSLHHAREPGGITSNIFYLWYLLEHYNSDLQIKAIIDNAELYFIPCINPDGYLYNISTYPVGGGMWRKNRRFNANATYGVDLNRNYGQFWGFDNIGSSNQANSETYRGTSAFSEPETQAVKWFSEQHHFGIALNYHTYNNELINSYAHLPVVYTPDSFAVSAYAFQLTQNNFYRYGTCFQCLGYVSNGTSDDWMYGEQTTKNKILAWTPEIGNVGNGFYPPAYQIIPDCKANLGANVMAAALILPYAKISTLDPNILTQQNGFLHFNFQRLGQKDTATYTVTAQALDSWITIPAVSKTFTNPGLLPNIADSFSYSINSATPNNQPIRYILKVNNGLYDLRDTIQFYYAKHYLEVNLPTNSFSKWNNYGWSINTQAYHSAPSSFKSSLANSNYPGGDDLLLTLKDTIDLSHAIKAYLQFYTRWDIEAKYDYAVVNCKETTNWNWTSLCGKYTKPGEYGQPMDAPVYDDHQYDWKLEQMDLGAYLGKKINLQFELVSDFDMNYPGIFIDDIKITMVRDSALGVTSILPDAILNIYPNPAGNEINIQVNNTNLKTLTATVIDVFGKEIVTKQFNGVSTVVNTTNLAEGIYTVKIFNEQFSYPVKKVEIIR
jgi:carboxypeptidase T